jgi:hypothetical protein
MSKVTLDTDLAGNKLSLETGVLAQQASGYEFENQRRYGLFSSLG